MDSALYFVLGVVIAANLLVVAVAITSAIRRKEIEN